MATFSQYGVGGFSGETIAADESYIGALGAFQMMEESAQNERAVFEFVLGCDFAEAATNNGVMTESEFEAINEASNGGIFSKVIAFFKKLIGKIKGIFKNAIDKITAICTKDGKELVRKFDKQINEKLNSGEYSDDRFKYEWCEANASFLSAAPVNLIKGFSGVTISCENSAVNGNSVLSVLANAKFARNESDTRDRGANKDDLDNYNNNKASSVSQANGAKALTSDELSDYKDNLLSAVMGSGKTTDASSFSKDFDEEAFESKDTVEGLTSARIDHCVDVLKNYEKSTKTLEKAERDLEKNIQNNIIKPAQNIEKEMQKRSRNDSANYGAVSALARTLAQSTISMGNVLSSVSSMTVASLLAAIKKEYKQSRALYIKAATYTKKRAKNEAALLEAYIDVSNNEVDEMMPEC